MTTPSEEEARVMIADLRRIADEYETALASRVSAPPTEDARVWVCARCGHAPAAHAMEGHPAFQCVYEPYLADPAVSAPPPASAVSITDEALLEAYRAANERAMREANLRDGFGSNMSRESILAGLRAVAVLGGEEKR